MLKILILPFLFIWELPQNLVGLVVYSIMKIKRLKITTELETHRIFIETPDTGVSLGWFIFWTQKGNRFPHLKNDCRMHEYGHARQSAILGFIYLVAVGIPSITRVMYRKWYRKKYGLNWGNYYSAFPENWADRLGGVIPPSN